MTKRSPLGSFFDMSEHTNEVKLIFAEINNEKQKLRANFPLFRK